MSTSTEKHPVMSIKAVVDKVKNKVVFVESNQDFVDVLLSFLTLPISTIIRLVGKRDNSQSYVFSSPTTIMSCMRNLYRSLHNLQAEHLETNECRTMLAFPQRASESILLNLKLQIDKREPTKYKMCKVHSDCVSYSFSKRLLCNCSSDQYKTFTQVQTTMKDGDRKVFVKMGRYIIGSDMNIRTASLDTCTSLLDICGITNWKRLEERTVNIGLDEVLLLLKCSIFSNDPLTDIILRKKKLLKPLVRTTENKNKTQRPRVPADPDHDKVTMKLVVRKSSKKVLYAIAKGDFVDLLFSFLTLPIGSIVNLCGSSSSLLCIDNLYKSVEDLSTEGQIRHQTQLISPKLSPHYGSEMSKLLRIEEAEPRFLVHANPRNSETSHHSKIMNPKCADRKETTGGGFIKSSSTFMVTNDLVVTPMCFTSGLFLLKRMKVPLNDVEERTVSIGEEEALNLLKASLVTDAALSSLINPHFLTPQKEVDRKACNERKGNFFKLW